MSAKTDEILDSLKSLSLLEASELVKQIEEAFGVSAAASAGVVMAAPGAAAGGDGADAAEEKTEFEVVLESFDASSKIKVLKEDGNKLLRRMQRLKFCSHQHIKVLSNTVNWKI